MQEILMKYTDIRCTYYPWLLTSGIKIVFIIIGSLILNKVIVTFIEKNSPNCCRPDGISSKDAEEKEKHANPNFTTSLKIAILIITGLMVLEEFSVEIGPILAAAGIVGLAFGFGGQSSEILFLVFYYS
jgi:small conductance mechanosensitive channel